MVVAGSGPRAVVTTASYEARRFGVFSATPAERARRLCPQAVFVAPDFEHYRARSREVMAVLRSQVERVEVVGLDEAYLDLTGLERHRAAARRVKAAVHSETGLCCSIGIGPSKLVAKVASDADKPDGFVELTRERGVRALRGRLPRADPRHRAQDRGAARVARRHDPGGARRSSRTSALADWFGGRLGPHLGRLARFEDERALELERVAKSESRETTFDRDLRGLERARAGARAAHASSSARRSASRDGRGRTIGIKVRLDDFSTVTRARAASTRPRTTCDTVWRVARELLRRARPARGRCGCSGVRVAGLDEERRDAPAAPADQLSLSL